MRVLFLILLFSSTANAQKLESINVDELYTRMRAGSDTTYVVNFWATWCKPCLEEMPYLLEEAENKKSQAFKLLLITLDFDSHIETRVKSFIEKNNVKEEVLRWNEEDANDWIPRISKDWTGSIPATMLFSNKGRKFHEGKMEKKDVREFIDSIKH